MRPVIERKKNLFSWISILALACVVGLLWAYADTASHRRHVRMPVLDLADPAAPSGRHAIEGLRVTSIVEGQRQFFLKADAFAIHKKKFGFLKFGLLNEARFEGVLLRLYGSDRPEKVSEEMQEISGRTFQLPDLAASFHKEGGPLAMVPGGRLSGIVMRPITVELYREEDLLAKITADKAYLRARDQQIVFQGHVRMTSGNRWLTTRRLSLAPQTAGVSVEAPYRRYHAGHVEEGRRLQTDLYLISRQHPENGIPNDA